MGTHKLIRNPLQVHTVKKYDVPSRAQISQPKVEFPQMAHGILLVLPPSPLTDCAKATLETVISLLQEAVICPIGLESTREIHALDFGKLETTDESFESNPIFEDYREPLAGEIGPTTPPARGLQLDRIGLILGCWLLSGFVINSPR